jgi:DNA-binding SARP family transcriptional activator
MHAAGQLSGGGCEDVVLRVNVLGPVMAWNGDQELPVGQPRQQAVLGILAMRANRIISRSELVDAVWGQDPPSSAEGGVYTYVAGLRRILEPGRSLRGPGRILVSSGAGYVLHLVPGQPDAVAFEQSLNRARQLRKTGELAGAVAELDAALGLWRGVAFAGVPGPFAETERARLGELHSAAAEERADALLAVGRHEEVLADLTAMVADNPLQERMRGLLMLALYRSGRQAQALRVFEEGRGVLAEELGIDPGAELCRIHQQVLTMDPALEAAAPATAIHVPVHVPAHLPADAPGFAGRRDELRALHGMLDPDSGSPPILIISGTAGVGKTALAIRFGREVAKRFPDGQLYLNLRGFDPSLAPVEPAAALRFILDAIGVPPRSIPSDTEGRSALFRSVADGKRMLIVLDNAADAMQVRPMLPGSAYCLVVVTSRSDLAGLVAADGAMPVSLDVLDDGEARELLVRRLGGERVLAEPEAADQIIAACARLPLALSIAVGRAASRPALALEDLGAELQQARNSLDALEVGDAVTDVRAVISWSYDRLSGSAAEMFRLLGVHPGPDISLSAAASLAALPRPEAGAALRELVRTHMVAEREHGRYTFHDLLRAYAAEQAQWFDSVTDQRTAVHRVLDHYLHTAMAASVRFSPYLSALRMTPIAPGVFPADVTDKNQALAWFEAEASVLLTLIDYAAAHGFDQHAWQIPWAMSAYFHRRGRWQDFEATQEIALAAAERLADKYALAHVHFHLARAKTLLNDLTAADPHSREALELFRELGDRPGEAVVLHGFSSLAERQGRYAEALTYELDALQIIRAAGHWWTQGALENGAGWLYAHLGQYQQALTHCERALGLHRESGFRGGVADTLDSLGYIYLHMGDLALARTHYDQALEAYRDIGDPLGEAVALTGLAETLAAGDETSGAREAWLAAAALMDQLSRRPEADEIRTKLAALDAQPGPRQSAPAVRLVGERTARGD